MTTASQIAATANRKPRKRPAPSPRDQQLYFEYQTYGKTQHELAEQYNLTQCRISQIICRVGKWLHTQDKSLGTDSAARKYLRQRLESERLNLVARLALREFQQQQKTVTYKSGMRHGEDFKETIEQIRPANLQCLKVILQANGQLNRLEQQKLQQEDQPPTAEQQREEVEAWLTERREDAQRAGQVPWGFGSNVLVRDLVSSLLGEQNDGVGLVTLAHESGKKIVERKSYEDESRPLPPSGNAFYPMYDYHGGLVAWLNAEQLAGAIPPEYPPVSRESTDVVVPESPDPADTQTRSANEGPGSEAASIAHSSAEQGSVTDVAIVRGSPDPVPETTATCGAPDRAPETCSTTCAAPPDSSQSPASSALTAPSPQTHNGALTLNDPLASGVIDVRDHCGVV